MLNGFVLDKLKNLYECRNCHEQHKRLSKEQLPKIPTT
jgi:hypothetical protein